MNQPFPIAQMPGQHAKVTEGGKGELGIFRSWLNNLYWYDLLTVATVLWEIWVLGPHISAGILFVWMFWQLRRYPWLCIILTAAPIWFYGVAIETVWPAWPTILWGRSPDQLRPWPLWVIALIPAPVWWRAWRKGEFRNSTEITDKYAPGTIKAREAHGGAVGPDNPYGDNGLMEEEPQQAPRQAPARAPFVIVTETREKGNFKASQRHEMSQRLEEKMPEIARYALGLQTPFSEPQMAGSGKPLSSRTFAPIRDELVELGALAWNPGGVTNGVRWTIGGLDLCKRFNGHSPTPPRSE